MHLLKLVLSQVSPKSSRPFPQRQAGEVSGTAGRHVRLHICALPVELFIVHGSPSSHELGQLPSQTSPRSMTRFPHTGLQSLSLTALAPGGQQPSPLAGVVICVLEHLALHCAAEPVSMSFVHAS